MRVPSISDLKTAIRIYYENIELGTKEIMELFNCKKSKATLLKKPVREAMAENNILAWNATRVNTQTAYQTWGIDIKDLEERLARLTKLKLSER